jgi:hypothetical protein
MGVTPGQAYPTAQAVMNRARSYVNDSFQGGAGRILTNRAPFTVEYLNGALEFLQDRIRNRGVITLEYDNVILSPILALAQSNPNLQQQVAFQGFFDGLEWHATPALPANCLSVLEVWEQQIGSGLPFKRMGQVRPLPSIFQGPWLNKWEYRQDRIILTGSTINEALRIRYQGSLQPIPIETPENQWANVSVQILASVNALATVVAYFYARARGAKESAIMQTDGEAMIKLITNRYTRQNQRVLYRRRGFGDKNIGRTALPF